MTINDDDDQRMLEHIGYEWWMFRATYLRLAERNVGKVHFDTVIGNALVESLAAHGRALIHFFFDVEGSPVREGEDGDVVAMHYGLPRPTIKREETPHIVRVWKTATDKRVAHITKGRLKQGWGSKFWPTGDLYRILEAKIEELRAKVGPLPFDASAPTKLEPAEGTDIYPGTSGTKGDLAATVPSTDTVACVVMKLARVTD